MEVAAVLVVYILVATIIRLLGNTIRETKSMDFTPRLVMEALMSVAITSAIIFAICVLAHV